MFKYLELANKNITAAVLEKKNNKLKKKFLKFSNLKSGQVLVKIFYTSICKSQIMEINGERGFDKYLPHLLGHEGCGEVIETGINVKKIKKGDKVILTWIKSNGESSQSGFFREINTKKKINYGPVTTFSNYTIVSENRLVKKPKKLDEKIASFYGCAILTGAGMVFNEAKPLKSEKVLVIGLGAVGLSALCALKAMGLKDIIAVDINDKKKKIAKIFGAKKFYNLNNQKTKKNFLKKYKDSFDLCIESAGKTSSIEFGFSQIKIKNGRLFFASHPNDLEVIRIKPHDLIKGKRIFGSWGGNCNPDIDIPKIFSIFKNKKIPVHKLIDKIYDFKDINVAIKDFEHGKVIRPVIKMNHE